MCSCFAIYVVTSLLHFFFWEGFWIWDCCTQIHIRQVTQGEYPAQTAGDLAIFTDLAHMMGNPTYILGASWYRDCEVSEIADGKQKKGRIKSRIHGGRRVWGVPLELARRGENSQIFLEYVGEREGREWHAKTHSTREGLGRCPNGGFSSLVSLLRPTHGSSVLPAVLSPTAPIHNLPSFLSWCDPCEKNVPSSLPFLNYFTASNKDGTIKHILEGFDTPEQVKAFPHRSTTTGNRVHQSADL